MEQLWAGEDGDFLALMHGKVHYAHGKLKIEHIGPSAFFLETVGVTPNRFRPANRVGAPGAEENNFVHL